MKPFVVGAALLAVLLLACGPKPHVGSVSASDVKDQATVVSVTLVNDAGAGAVRLLVTVTDAATGEVVGREETSVDMKDHERLTVAVEVHVPATVKAVEGHAEARYPPD